jgi:hypothetical protein
LTQLDVLPAGANVLSEHRLRPGASIPPDPRVDAEIVTYVREGALRYEDTAGRSGVLHAGEFSRMTVRGELRHWETNASRTHEAHVFQVWLGPTAAGRDSGHEQRRFSLAQRRGCLCVVASRDAREGSLRLYEDALVYSAVLDPGRHVVHALSQGRSAWLQMVRGQVCLGDGVLSAGRGIGIQAERAVSFTALEETEILLVDV